MRNIKDFYVKINTGLGELERLYGEIAAVKALKSSGGGDKKSPVRNEGIIRGIIRKGES